MKKMSVKIKKIPVRIKKMPVRIKNVSKRKKKLVDGLIIILTCNNFG